MYHWHEGNNSHSKSLRGSKNINKSKIINKDDSKLIMKISNYKISDTTNQDSFQINLSKNGISSIIMCTAQKSDQF